MINNRLSLRRLTSRVTPCDGSSARNTRDNTHEVISLRVFAFAALIGIRTLAGSAQYSPVAARGFGPDYGWMGNQKYMACIKYVAPMVRTTPGGTRISGPARRNTFRVAADGGLEISGVAASRLARLRERKWPRRVKERSDTHQRRWVRRWVSLPLHPILRGSPSAQGTSSEDSGSMGTAWSSPTSATS